MRVESYASLKAMGLEVIPGLTDEVNTEVQSMNEEFSGHQIELGSADKNADISPACAGASVDLEASMEDREEEAIVHKYFGKSMLCLRT